ncbi:hypothetical protein C8Q78DRAFT_983373, partial [Trametes maxima]
MPRWQVILREAGANASWIDEISRSLIPDLSPGLRVGAFICPVSGDGFTPWINHVPCMIKANLPVYIYWPENGDNYDNCWAQVIRAFPYLGLYRPYNTNVVEVPLSNDEHISYNRQGRPYVVNPQNSF